MSEQPTLHRKHLKGIVINEESGKVDFSIIKKNFDFVFMRTSYRSLLDQCAIIYNEDCQNLSIPLFYYHDTWAQNEHQVAKECAFIQTLPFDLTTQNFGIRYTDQAQTKAMAENAYLHNGNITDHKYRIITSFIPNITPKVNSKYLIFYMKYTDIIDPRFNLIKDITPLWYYRNTKSYDNTKCVFWQKRLSAKVEGVQNKAGIIYKINN